jgi:hypothetical protein
MESHRQVRHHVRRPAVLATLVSLLPQGSNLLPEALPNFPVLRCQPSNKSGHCLGIAPGRRLTLAVSEFLPI